MREVQYPKWISNIVPVRKKNRQVRVCVDFRDLNAACPKDDFPLPITELMIDATVSFVIHGRVQSNQNVPGRLRRIQARKKSEIEPNSSSIFLFYEMS